MLDGEKNRNISLKNWAWVYLHNMYAHEIRHLYRKDDIIILCQAHCSQIQARLTLKFKFYML